MPQAETAATSVLRILDENGVSHVFGVPGGPLLALYEALADSQALTSVLAKHEEGAAFMAQGHAQVSGRLGVVCATTGPGATNALTAVASANADGVPLLMISGQAARDVAGMGSLQDSSGGNWSMDLVDVFRTVTKLSTMVVSAARLPSLLEHAIRTAISCSRSGSRPS